MNLLIKLQNIDRRILYLIVAAVLAIPILMRPSSHPKTILIEVRNAYNTINKLDTKKLVLISTFYGPGTRAENEPQMEALMRHMFLKGIKFAVISWDPAGAELSYKAGERIQKEMHKKYGVDWVHFGYRTGALNILISGMAENLRRVMDHDRFNTNINKLPALDGIYNYKQIGAVIEVTPSGTVGTWISYFTGPKNIPLIYCPTAVMSAEAYPYLDSGQIKGMLNGVMGAAQYETLIGMKHVRTYAAAASWALSSAHIFIILLIILGNLGYLASKRAGGQRGGTRVG